MTLKTCFVDLYNTCQSAYRPGHSTETALLKVVNDLFLSLNKGNISVLALLDFSSAFDTIDHTILVHRLHTDFGFTDTVLQWFSSYLTDRTHYVSLCNHCSDFAPVHSGVPQGSVLGPILFTMYIKPLSAIIDSHSIIHHSFPDDLQLQMSAPPDRISELLHSMQSCISDVKAWATVNMLRLNDSKTELMLVTSKRSKHLQNPSYIRNTCSSSYTCIFSIDLHKIRQHLVVTRILLLILSGNPFQMISGVPHHCHHIILI